MKTNRKQKFKNIIFDIHGVLLGRHNVKETMTPEELISYLDELGFNLYFITNSSSMSQEEIAFELRKENINIGIDRIFTAGMTMGHYIYQKYTTRNIYLIGSKTLKTFIDKACEFQVNWCEGKDADIVVVARDINLTQLKIAETKLAAANGAILLATCDDHFFYSTDKIEIGPGYVVNKVKNAMRTQPIIVGKPNSFVLTNVIGLTKEEITSSLVVGDSLSQDIQFGINGGCTTALLLNKRNIQGNANITPDYILTSFEQLYSLIEENLCMQV
jgi:HAD superfamily hydrolase (TIGR01450 family)